MPDLENEFRQQIRIIMQSTDYINKFAGFALANVKRDKRRRSKISITAIASKVINTFADSLESKQGIKINTTIAIEENSVPAKKRNLIFIISKTTAKNKIITPRKNKVAFSLFLLIILINK